MINVTKSFLPPVEQYKKYVDEIWQRGHLTNHGPLVLELEEKLKSFLGVKHFYFVSNGTVALQIAIKALDLRGEIITTPFSYVATISSIVWENAQPAFVDIDTKSLTIDATKIESAITKDTSAILATHVYGIPCDVEAINEIAKRNKLKIIYDAAHAFGVKYKERSILNFGDIATLSFHATKLFHTIEGGGIATNNDALAHRISYMRNFGHNGEEDFWGLGINGKNSEFHAAMGLCNFPYIKSIVEKRKAVVELYEKLLKSLQSILQRPVIPEGTEYNYAYYPVIFANEQQLLKVRNRLNASQIFPRRYFYPSLDKLPYVSAGIQLPIATAISSRILCLPLYHSLPLQSVTEICSLISETLNADL
jgi:dTDP-4-amino-4,6-dideoxygalactose transaminase